jgi:hypothetical protein
MTAGAAQHIAPIKRIVRMLARNAFDISPTFGVRIGGEYIA